MRAIKIVLSSLLGLMFCAPGLAVESSEYLPQDADLDPSIPTPESILGWEVGEWRVSHDQLVRYMQTLAASSARVSIKIVGQSHELRPILQLIFTSPDNHARLEELRQQHLRSALTGIDHDSPLVVWLGHSIHGNEESGSNGAMLSAYYLAASRSKFVTDLLDEGIILLDPSFNPDGLNRFASWSNANRSMNPVADRNHRINNEAWPGARTNHYLFDLNRDWLPLVHPESRARVAEFHRWLPHVLTDQHERRGDGYFFQPGVPSRQNPLTPIENLEMTRALAQYHARAMDRAGEIFFSEDDYDDFYFGKGSSYPDINGSIGILYEQPNIKGPVLERDTGLLTFVNAIQNHLRTTLSTLQGAYEMRDRLKIYQHSFFKIMNGRAREAGFAAWLVGDDGDPARAAAFLSLLDQHQIEYSPLAQDVRAEGKDFRTGHAWVLATQQRQFGLLQAIMEVRTEFEDDTFYDVSAWTQPLAYNLPYTKLSRLPRLGNNSSPLPGPAPDEQATAWIIPWNQLDAPALLQQLLDAGLRIRTATKPFAANSSRGTKEFNRGDIVIHAGLQEHDNASKAQAILAKAVASGIEVFSVISSLTPDGPDLGAPHFKLIKPVEPLLIVGEGVSPYGAGEVWHHFDQRLGFAPVMVEMHRLAKVRLSDYTHLIMTDGSFSAIDSSQEEGIIQWIREGGILVASAKASAWVESLCFSSEAADCEQPELEDEEQVVLDRPYADFKNDEAQLEIGGAIVTTRIDTTHPIAFGYQRSELPVFRKGTVVLKPSDNAYSTPVRYSDAPLKAGFIGAQRLAEISGQPAVIAERKGAGLVVRFANSPLFRGFWRGTERLFNNALYMSQVIESTNLPD